MTDSEINETVARKLGFILGDGKNQISEGRIGLIKNYEVLFVGPLPDYCHSIATAWEVVEHCDSVTYIQCPAVGGKKWHVDIGNMGWSEADTAPMAICLAFLKLSLDKKGERG